MSDFENNLKDMFEGAELQPSEKVWAGVEASLKQKKKRAILFYWRTYGSAAAVVLIALITYLFSAKQETSRETLTKSGESKQAEHVADSLKSDEFNRPALLTETDSAAKEGGNLTNQEYLAELKEDQETLQKNQSAANQLIKQEKTLLASAKIMEEALEVANQISMAELKPYRPSLALNQVEWLNRLGVGKRDLSGLIAEEIKAEFIAENTLSGRVGSNSLLLDNPTGALSVEDAQLGAVSSLSHQEESALGALSAGIGFSFDLSKKLKLNTSLRYSEFKTASTSNAYFIQNSSAFPIYLPLGFDEDNVNFVGSYGITNTLQAISLLPSLSYELVSLGKFNISLMAGFGVDYFFSYKVKGELNFLSTLKADLSRSDFINEWNLSTLSGFSLNYRLNEKFGLSADLTYRYFIPTTDSDQRRSSSMLGFGMGLNYFLKRKD